MSSFIDVRFNVQGAIREDRQTKSFVSYCPMLNLYSAGRTRIDAKKALVHAVDSYVRICYERGILGRILKDKGLIASPSVQPTHPDRPSEFIAVTEYASDYDDIFDVEVPLHLVAEAAKQPEKSGCPQ